LAVFADQPDTLGVAMRTEIEAHLSVCAACRDEIRVLGAVRIERAAAAEVEEHAAVESLEALRARVAQRSGGRRAWRRRSMLLLAFALAAALVVIGERVLEQGASLWPLELPVIDRGLSSQPRPGTDRSVAASPADDVSGEMPSALGDVAVRPQPQPPPPPAAGRPVFSAPPLRSSGAPPVASDGSAVVDGAMVEEGAAAGVVEDLPLASARQEVLSPEELVASLAAQAAKAPGESEPDASGQVSADTDAPGLGGAALVELAETMRLESAPEAARDTVGEPRETAEIPTESMIVGVRDLGSVPTRAMVGAEGSEDSEGTEAGEPQAGGATSYAPTLPARVLFAGGSSYLFTMDEVNNGIDLQFALPLVETQTHGAEVRVRELGSERELKESFAAPDPAVQTSPLQTLRVPAGWLRPGRFTVQLDAPTVEGFEPQSVHLRILEGD
jgi:hypothetical protein